MRHARLMLLMGAALPLAACGADDVASPGEGVIVVPAPAPTPAPTPPTSPTPTPPTVAVPDNCPTGTANVGVLQTVNGNRRQCQISGRISSNLALAQVPGVIYSMTGRVDVGTDVGGDGQAAGGNPVSLTIGAGVVVFASSGNDFLVVNRGSRIDAQGTATRPIIFTSRANVLGTATDSSQGQWGGIVILGRAPISDCLAGAVGGAANCQQQIEGTTNALYGGNVAGDSSGVMRYVQIRYSGFEIAPGNELQALTTGGVGSGTTFEFIQSHNSSDDGVEFFGGRHNVRNLVITGADDDSLDTDLGYQGFIQFVIAVQRDGANGDQIIEADSNGNEDALPRQNTRLANFTFVHRSTVQSRNAILLRGGTDYALYNGIVTSAANASCLDIRGAQTVRAADAALQDVGPPVFRSIFFSCGSSYNANAVAGTPGVFTTDPNNVAAGTSSLTGVFLPGANERAVPVFNASTVNAFFRQTDYIGAVRDANDTWYRGWTCDSGYAPFGSNSLCTRLPTDA